MHGLLVAFLWFAACSILSSATSYLLFLKKYSDVLPSFAEKAAASFLLSIPLTGFLAIASMLLTGPGKISALLPYCIQLAIYIYARSIHAGSKPQILSNRSRYPYILLMFMIAAIFLPYSHIGKKTEEGFAYRAYFDHDFFVHLAVCGEISHGNIPPRNPYFASNPLHYYWLVFTIPAQVYRLADRTIELESILIFMNASIALSVCLLFFRFTAHLLRSEKTAFFSTLAVIFCGSYEGLFWIFHHVRSISDIWNFRSVNIDGFSRWVLGTPQIDNLMRGLFFTPQHLTAIGLVVICWLIIFRNREQPFGKTIFVMPVFFILLAMAPTSAFIGLVFSAWLIFHIIFASVYDRNKHLRDWMCLFGANVISLGILQYLQMISPQSTEIEFKFHNLILSRDLEILFLNTGPVFISGGIGYCILFIKDRFYRYLPLAGMFLLSSAFIFLFSIPDYENEFGLRAGFLLFVSSLPGLGRYLLWIRHENIFGRILLLLFTVIAFSAAGITSVMDLYNLQDISNPKFTTLIDFNEKDALNWVKANTSQHAIVQNKPEKYDELRKSSQPNTIAPFAQRCMAAGTVYYSGQFQIGKENAEIRVESINRLMRNEHALDLLDPERNFSIDYWLIGPEEITSAKSGIHKFTNGLFFDSVFENATQAVIDTSHSKIPGIEKHLKNRAVHVPDETVCEISKEAHPVEAEGLDNLVWISGWESRIFDHDWIFSSSDVVSDLVHLAVRNPSALMIETNAITVRGIEFDAMFPSCTSKTQKVYLWIDDVFCGCAQLLSGWHRVCVQCEQIPIIKDKTLILFKFEVFEPAKNVCTETISIPGQQSIAGKNLLVRSGPAPSGGFYGDIFFNGKNLSPHQPGYNLVSITDDHQQTFVFDHTDRYTMNQKISEWIENLAPGSIVAGVALAGAEKALDQTGIAALKKLGLDVVIPTEKSQGHAFIGLKGANLGDALESIPEHTSDFVYLGRNQGNIPFGIAVKNVSLIAN